MGFWLLILGIVFLAAQAWFGCGGLAFGFHLGFLQRGWPTLAQKYFEEDRHHAFVTACFGPIGLFATFALGMCRHGLLFDREAPCRSR